MSVSERPDFPERIDEAATLYRLTDRLYRARTDRDVYEAALDAITAALGCARASILLFDEAGVMRFVAARGLSDDYRTKLEGHTPWKPDERDPHPIFVSDIDDTAEADWIKAAIKKENIRALSFIPLVAQGGCIGKFMSYYESARVFAAPEAELAITIARQVGFSIERLRAEKAREAAEQDLRESEERFRLMSEHAPVMIWMSDAKGQCLHLNKLLRDFWGVGDGDLTAFDWSTMMHPEDAPLIGAAVMEAIGKGTGVKVQGRYRDAAGRYRVLQTDARPRMSNGEFIGMIGVNTDITEREETEAARKLAESNRELLVAELNHRVKNTLSVVQALAYQTFRGTAQEPRVAFEGRLLALARSHDLLTQANWDTVSLKDLATASVQIQGSPGPRISVSGPEIMLSPREALSIGMALHELFTNALKYGALSSPEGRISLSWARRAGETPGLDIVWLEEDGPPVSAPSRSGFGSVLLQRTLTGDLNAEVDLDFRPAGLRCSIKIPLRKADQ
jgi:PAS domain S-box-containing protein